MEALYMVMVVYSHVLGCGEGMVLEIDAAW